ncbi:c-type cytochrome [Hydrogenovibrio sp. JE_KL2]|uniref:c-type cytochrome n=1 Tax=Hydrogenovibrio sp. JE_KL2 TaxID=2651188 RepID=UPI0020A41167|nr:c-type cytochrome [Hydrogenovibrio sp. JE_KL2]
MKLKALFLTSLLCGSSVALVGCGHSDNQTASSQNAAKQAEPLTSSTADKNLMPPNGEQTSTMDVKTQNLTKGEPETTAPAEDLEKAEPEKTAIDNEPHPPVKTGEEIFATCSACHGDHGQGGVGPKLQGLKKADIIAKLQAYKAGKSFGPMSSMMIPNAQQLSEADIKSVAAYIAKF